MPRKRAVDGYINNQDSGWPIITNNTPRDWILITGRGDTKWENCGSETFCAPPQDRIKLFASPVIRLDYSGFGFISQSFIMGF